MKKTYTITYGNTYIPNAHNTYTDACVIETSRTRMSKETLENLVRDIIEDYEDRLGWVVYTVKTARNKTLYTRA